MILLEVDSSSLALVELKRDAPGAVDMNRIARWLVPAQPVEIKAWEIDVRRFCGYIKSIKHQQCTRLKIRSNPAASPFFEQLAKALVLPRSNHI